MKRQWGIIKIGVLDETENYYARHGCRWYID